MPPICPPTRTVTPAGTIGTAGITGALSCVLALSSTATVLALAILMPVLTAHLLARALTLSLALAILIPVLMPHLMARAWPLSRTRQGLLLRLSRAGGRACCRRSLTTRSERSKDCKGKWNKRIHGLLLQQRFNPCPMLPADPLSGIEKKQWPGKTAPPCTAPASPATATIPRQNRAASLGRR